MAMNELRPMYGLVNGLMFSAVLWLAIIDLFL
jgi:hypothetical protein